MTIYNLSLIIDNKNTLYNIFLLLLARENYPYEPKQERDEVLSVTKIKNKKLECAKILLFLLTEQNNKKCTVKINDYLSVTKRDIKNLKDIKIAINNLTDLKVYYYNNKCQLKTTPVFDFIYIKSNNIHFRFSDYIKSKINICGRGHKLVSVNPQIFVDEGYRCHAKNRLKLLLNFAIITNVLICSESKSELATAEKDEFYDIIYKTKNDLYKNLKMIDCLYNNIKKQVDFHML